jgi:cell division protein FtsN
MHQCNDCGNVTDQTTGQGPAEGLDSNNDMLQSACMDWMKNNEPEQYRMLADTVAGHPDPGTQPGGAPIDSAPENSAPIPTPEPEPTEPTAPEPEALPEPAAPYAASDPAPSPEDVAAAAAVLDQAGVQHG